jgi:hypothetical protein
LFRRNIQSFIVQNFIWMKEINEKKAMFIMNALENGWTVKKIEDKYIFTKKHENRKEVFEENYLWEFVGTNLNIDNKYVEFIKK